MPARSETNALAKLNCTSEADILPVKTKEPAPISANGFSRPPLFSGFQEQEMLS